MKKILLIGATSAIAEATARIWAKRGDEIFLVARNQERLTLIANDLMIRGARNIHSLCLDVNSLELHNSIIDSAYNALGKIDLVLIAHGTLANQPACEASVDLTMHEIKTNALSVISLLTQLTNRFEIEKSGTIAVISSVAGDRGRQSNYIYGCAKAMVSSFTSGLRQRLYKTGVSIVTIKPGFIDTPMTADFTKGILWVKPEKVAQSIAKICDAKNGEFYVPGFWWAIMMIIKCIPERIFVQLKL